MLEIHPRDLGLSDGLTLRIRAWMDDWDTNYHYERGWIDEPTRAASRAERLGILDALRAEAGEYLEITDGVFFD